MCIGDESFFTSIRFELVVFFASTCTDKKFRIQMQCKIRSRSNSCIVNCMVSYRISFFLIARPVFCIRNFLTSLFYKYNVTRRPSFFLTRTILYLINSFLKIFYLSKIHHSSFHFVDKIDTFVFIHPV